MTSAICNKQGSAADIAMCAMLEICKNQRLKELGWKLLLQVNPSSVCLYIVLHRIEWG